VLDLRPISAALLALAAFGCGTWAGNPNDSKKPQTPPPAVIEPPPLLAKVTFGLRGLGTLSDVRINDGTGALIGTLSVTDAKLAVDSLTLRGALDDAGTTVDTPTVVDLVVGRLDPAPPPGEFKAGAYHVLDVALAGSQTLDGKALRLAGTFTAKDATTHAFSVAFDAGELAGLRSGSDDSHGFQLAEGEDHAILLAFDVAAWLNFASFLTNPAGVDLAAIGAGDWSLGPDATGAALAAREVIKANILASVDFGSTVGGLYVSAARSGRFDGQQGSGIPDLGANAYLNGKPVFPASDAWNRDVSKDPVDPNSDALIASCGAGSTILPAFGGRRDGAPFGMPFVIVDASTPRRTVDFEYADQSDPGPYPFPQELPFGYGADPSDPPPRIVIDRDTWKLYELAYAYTRDGGKSWSAGAGAVFDLASSKLRPAGWTSANGSGLPYFPGLVRYQEVGVLKAIKHALTYTCPKTRHAYLPPARHLASALTDPDLPPMGMRVRLKAGVDLSKFSPSARVILTALKTYGMLLIGHGQPWYMNGVPDDRWDDDDLQQLRKIDGRSFEVVRMDGLVTSD
jgi:hypothetical protein